jgi:hypothetical protein
MAVPLGIAHAQTHARCERHAGARSLREQERAAAQVPARRHPGAEETIERQLELTRKLEVEQFRVIPWLFHNGGERIVNYLSAWHKAVAAAGPALAGRIPHDFRRMAARNLVGAGADPLTAMALVGGDGPVMLKRYAIIDEETLKRGAAKLAEYHDEQKARPGKVAALADRRTA